MADVSNGPFDYKDAVTCLQNMDFDSNVGKLSPSKLNQGHCPLIAELADKKAVLTKIVYKKEYIIFDSKDPKSLNHSLFQNLKIILRWCSMQNLKQIRMTSNKEN